MVSLVLAQLGLPQRRKEACPGPRRESPRPAISISVWERRDSGPGKGPGLATQTD